MLWYLQKSSQINVKSPQESSMLRVDPSDRIQREWQKPLHLVRFILILLKRFHSIGGKHLEFSLTSSAIIVTSVRIVNNTRCSVVSRLYCNWLTSVNVQRLLEMNDFIWAVSFIVEFLLLHLSREKLVGWWCCQLNCTAVRYHIRFSIEEMVIYQS